MEVKEILKSIEEMETLIQKKDEEIRILQKENKLLKSDNENTELCLKEREERLKKTLKAIMANVKEGLNPEKLNNKNEEN